MNTEAVIATEYARRIRIHTLRQTLERLRDARVGIKNLFALDELPADIKADLLALLQRIEDSETRAVASLEGSK